MPAVEGQTKIETPPRAFVAHGFSHLLCHLLSPKK